MGCPKNLVDSEMIAGLLNAEGFISTGDLNEAESIIVNTCAFISDAKEEAINQILEVARLKEEANLKVLVVTGCLAQRYSKEIVKEIPEVDLVVGTGSIGSIAKKVKQMLEESGSPSDPILCEPHGSLDYLNGTRVISDNKPFAYLKVAEGCSNRCNYCIIPMLRGDFRSRAEADIVKEARFLGENGKKEIILVAQDVTRYGLDLYGEKRLVSLIGKLSAIEEVKRIRLLYCYPELIDDNLIEEMIQNPKLCNYFDVPVQHISDDMLKAMGRRGNKAEYMELFKRIKDKIPGVTLRTSLITGFPGETEADFEELKSFVELGLFDHLGVFAYSREEGTPADKMKGHLTKKVKEQRRNLLMKIQHEKVLAANQSKIGLCYDVMVEGVADDGIFYVGRSYREAPEIDPVIYFTSPDPLNMGDYVKVKILCSEGYDLTGEVID